MFRSILGSFSGAAAFAGTSFVANFSANSGAPALREGDIALAFLGSQDSGWPIDIPANWRALVDNQNVPTNAVNPSAVWSILAKKLNAAEAAAPNFTFGRGTRTPGTIGGKFVGVGVYMRGFRMPLAAFTVGNGSIPTIPNIVAPKIGSFAIAVAGDADFGSVNGSHSFGFGGTPTTPYPAFNQINLGADSVSGTYGLTTASAAGTGASLSMPGATVYHIAAMAALFVPDYGHVVSA
jgi:hypothetical protein